MDIEGLGGRLTAAAAERKLYYHGDLLRGIEAALSVPHRFVIFYGPPGVGKTQLVALIAQALGADLLSVPVQAGWRGDEVLVGCYDGSAGLFRCGPLVSLARRAAAAPEKFFLCCLEEMSLGRPEEYLSTLLSGLGAEPPRLYLPMPGEEAETGDGVIPRELPLPINLLFLGTLHMDADNRKELPRKLIDRAALFELEFGNLQQFLAVWDRPFPGKEPLVDVCDLLRSYGFKLGYRAFREIGTALAKANTVGLAPDVLLDQLMKARLLPVVRGDAGAAEDCLRALVKLLSAEEVRFPQTLDKAVRMLEDLGLRGYTAAYLS